MAILTPFHLAIPVSNLKEAKDFYSNKLECKPGRFTEEWADYSLFGHQLVLHEDLNHKGYKHFNEVDGKNVPIPHFGVVLEWSIFQVFSKKLISKDIESSSFSTIFGKLSTNFKEIVSSLEVFSLNQGSGLRMSL